MAFSPDGRRIISGSSDNTLRLWDATSGREVLTLKGHTGFVCSVTFSPDGKRIVSGSDYGDNTLKVWDATTGQETLTLKGHIGRVSSVAFSPDGKRIVSAGGDGLKVWDATNGKETLTLKNVGSVAFSPDGKRIVGGEGTTLKVWDATSGQETLTLWGHTGGVHCVAFSPDGRRIVSGSSDNTLKVWDATAIKPTHVLEKYVYDGGSFTMCWGEGKTEWVESKTNDGEFRFAETERSKDWIRLFDSSRNMVLCLPVRGGTCYWSTDDGKTWNASHHVDRDGKTVPQSAKTSVPIEKPKGEEIYIPKDLDDCFAELKKKMSQEDTEKIRGLSEQQTIDFYYGAVRTWMNDSWGLWRGSRLSKWFKEKGVWHSDDMAGIILTSFWRHLNNKPLMLDEQIRHYQDFWNKARVQLQAPSVSPAPPPVFFPPPEESSIPSPILRLPP